MKDLEKHKKELYQMFAEISSDNIEKVYEKRRNALRYFIDLAIQLKKIENSGLLPEKYGDDYLKLNKKTGGDVGHAMQYQYGRNDCIDEIKLRLLKKLEGINGVIMDYIIKNEMHDSKDLSGAIRNHILGKE